MKTNTLTHALKWLFSILMCIQFSTEAYASHAVGADITYQCLGGNQYQITVTFYRDCAGANAPNSVTVNCSSISCNENFNTTLNPIPGTGIEVTNLCSSVQTTCNGGSYPGIQQYIYQGNVVLPEQCSDWVFSFSLCCRNAAISTISNPGSANIYVEAHLDNLNYSCHSSPYFTNPPIAFPCVGQTFCFNHGAVSPNGDSLSYALVAPATGPTTTVTYLPGYSASQPLQSNPAVTLNPVTGDICMTPTMQEVTVTAVTVYEWRNGQIIGSVTRDIQIRTHVCNNTTPTLSGINGTNIYSDTVCAGAPFSFNIPSYDPDTGQNLTLTWNNGISGATFNPGSGQHPTGVFTWTPTNNDISNTPHCFTVKVKDDNCPFNSFQTYSFCITVTGFSINVLTQDANCGASNGSATLQINGGNNPFTYQWSSGSTQSFANGLSQGNYSVTVTDSNGCQQTSPFSISNGSIPGNLNMNETDVSCYNGANGVAWVNVNGGQGPYTYLWNTGATSAGINGIPAGTYWVQVSTAQGCTSSDTIVVNQPVALNINSSATGALCNGGASGSATVNVSGGTPGYTYAWGTNPVQTTQTATGLIAGNYSITVTDNNGCMATQNVTVNEPAAINIASTTTNVTCPNGTNGQASTNVTGGTPGYTYLWNTNPVQNTSTATNLPAGIYAVTVTDNNGCTANQNVTITQPSAFNVIVASFNSVSCFGGNNGSISINASGGTPGYSYLWNTNPPQYSNTATNLSAGTHSVTITDANGCSFIYQTNISQPSPLQSYIMSINNVSCYGNSDGNAAVMTSGGTPPYAYLWNTTPTQNTNTAQNLNAGNYWAYVTDARGCKDSNAVTIVQPQPIYTTVQPFNPTICPGQNANLLANATGGSGGYTFNWNDGFAGGVHTVSPSQDTLYIVTATDANGCVGLPDSVTVIINDINKITLTADGTDSICEGEQAKIWANVTNGTGNYLFQWANGVGTTAGPIAVYPNQNTYYVITVTDQCGNTKSDSVLVKVDSLPDVFLLPQNKKNCGQVSFNYQNEDNINPSDNYYWNFGDGTATDSISGTKTYDASGTYSVYLKVTSTQGCVNSDSTKYMATVYPMAKPNFDADPDSISILDGHIHFNNYSDDANYYYWNFGDGSNSQATNPTHHYIKKGTYVVTLTANNEYNCKAVYTKEIKILPEFSFFIPNAFTPNGNGTNDNFRGYGKEISQYTMYIFDRWGEKIFETHQLDKGWDGTYRGKMAPVDEYVYLVELKTTKGQTHEYKGGVALVR